MVTQSFKEATNKRKEELVERAAQYRAFASFFLDLPTKDMVEAYREFVQEAEGETPGCAELQRFFESEFELSDSELLTSIGVDRTFLVRGTTKKGPKPPYGSMYSGAAEAARGTEAGPEMLAIKASYRAAGLSVSSNVHESPDYLGVELMFMSELLFKAADACSLGDGGEVESLINQADTFFESHLKSFACEYAKEAQAFARTGFCRGLMLLLEEFISEESEGLSRF